MPIAARVMQGVRGVGMGRGTWVCKRMGGGGGEWTEGGGGMLRCWISVREKRDIGGNKRDRMWHRADKDYKLV